MVANRILPSLEMIINMDQKGFLANRCISINIRRILDMIFYADQEKLDILILSFDFETCFNKIDFSAIFGSMEYFEFAPYLVKWTRII